VEGWTFHIFMEIDPMIRQFTLEYWIDDGWYVGRLEEVPGVFSQGESLEELEENIRDAYQLMMADEEVTLRVDAQTKALAVEV
jgi:predicted RNase H-like HicB family nuclease